MCEDQVNTLAYQHQNFSVIAIVGKNEFKANSKEFRHPLAIYEADVITFATNFRPLKHSNSNSFVSFAIVPCS